MDQFLQSESWARFQSENGRKSVSVSSRAFGFVHTLPIVGKYLYTPRFPRAGEEKTDIVSLARQSGCSFVRVEPESENEHKSLSAHYGNRMVRSPHDMQPKEIFVVDIRKSEDELFSEMKSKTRYNIRLAEKKNVKAFPVTEEKYREIFFELLDATARRQNILLHPREYYENMFDVFGEQLILFVAEYEGKVLAANLVLFFGDTATYLHGGTSDEYREAMAPVLLQWEQIREAKRRGCSWYDFGGVSEESNATWKGITRFKTGFSPRTPFTVYPGCYDIIVDPGRYTIYRILRFAQVVISMLKKMIR